jgi:type IV secretory pathway VirB4 component
VRLIEQARRKIDAARERIRLAGLWEAGQRSFLDRLAPEWTEHTPDAYGFGRGGRECWTRTLAVRDWPPKVVAGWLAPLLFDLGGDVRLVQHVEAIATPEAIRRLRTQRTLQTSVAQARLERGAISDPAEALDLASAEEIATAVAAGEERLFSVGMYLCLRSTTREELEELERRVRERLLALGVTLSSTRWQHRAGFRTAGVLYAHDRLERRRTLDTTSLTFSLPFLSESVGTGEGPLVGVSLADKGPVFLDLFSRPEGWNNPCLCLVSPPGGGKTVTIGTWACRHLTLPEPVYVILIDPMKGDYRRLVKQLGGQIIRIATRPDVVINPLDLPPSKTLSGTGEESEQNPVLEQTRLVIGLVSLMVAEEGKQLHKAERARVDGAILAAYAEAGIDPDDEATWEAGPQQVPTLGHVLAELERGDETAVGVAVRLRPYVTGTLSGLFSGRTTVELGARLTSFDLEGLDSELRPLAVWLIGDHTWKLAKRDRKKRILSMDEVKTLLEYPESARLVAHLYTLGRAYNLSVWSATQLLSDYTSTPEGERALQTADSVLLLRQAAGKGVADAAGRYGLSEGDRLFLEAARQGHGILRTPRGHARVRVVPSPWELELMGGPSEVKDGRRVAA